MLQTAQQAKNANVNAETLPTRLHAQVHNFRLLLEVGVHAKPKLFGLHNYARKKPQLREEARAVVIMTLRRLAAKVVVHDAGVFDTEAFEHIDDGL